MHIHDTEQAVVIVLQLHPVFDGSHIRTQGQFAAGLNAGKDALFLVHEKTTPCVRNLKYIIIKHKISQSVIDERSKK